jgi:hypothetical protein
VHHAARGCVRDDQHQRKTQAVSDLRQRPGADGQVGEGESHSGPESEKDQHSNRVPKSARLA